MFKSELELEMYFSNAFELSVKNRCHTRARSGIISY